MIQILAFAARYGRYVLVVGLVAGLLLPGVALHLKPWIPQMIVFLLFLTAFRIGAKATLQGLAGSLGTLKLTLIYQLVLPLAALGVFIALGISSTPVAIAIVLMLAAPPVTGSPNFAILLGQNPEPAFRVLILGTAILPLTLIPVFYLSPDLGGLAKTLLAALKLLGAIWVSVLLAFLARNFVSSDFIREQTKSIDGLMAITLAVVVIGLMPALGPALRVDPLLVLKWLAVTMAANLGLKFITFRLICIWGEASMAAPLAIVAGNRNFALFFIALPAATTDSLLIFLGCYQVPMFLTPFIMKYVYRNSPQK